MIRCTLKRDRELQLTENVMKDGFLWYIKMCETGNISDNEFIFVTTL